MNYEQALEDTRTIEKEKDKSISEVGSKAVKVKDFVLDTKMKVDKALKRAAEKFGTAKTIGAMVGGGIALATGAAPLVAAAYAFGGTVAGGLWGQSKARKELAGMDYMKKSQSDLFTGMRKQTGKEALVNAVMAGVTAKGAGDMTKEAGKGTLGDAVTKKASTSTYTGIPGKQVNVVGKKSLVAATPPKPNIASTVQGTSGNVQGPTKLRTSTQKPTLMSKVKGRGVADMAGQPDSYKSIFKISDGKIASNMGNTTKTMGQQAVENLKVAGKSVFSNK